MKNELRLDTEQGLISDRYRAVGMGSLPAISLKDFDSYMKYVSGYVPPISHLIKSPFYLDVFHFIDSFAEVKREKNLETCEDLLGEVRKQWGYYGISVHNKKGVLIDASI